MSDYHFDPSNKLTYGLPVPSGYRPLGPSEHPDVGDFFVQCMADCFYRARDIVLFETRALASRVSFSDEVYFRKLNPNPELLDKIPDGYEMYDKPGEAPKSVEGWLFIFNEQEGSTLALHIWEYQNEWAGGCGGKGLENYARTWCLARPVAEVAAELNPYIPPAALEKLEKLREDLVHRLSEKILSLPATKTPPGPEWRVVEHRSRDERDAAWIDTTGPTIRLGHAWSPDHAQSTKYDQTLCDMWMAETDRIKRDSTWMRGGYKAAGCATTVDVGADWED